LVVVAVAVIVLTQLVNRLPFGPIVGAPTRLPWNLLLVLLLLVLRLPVAAVAVNALAPRVTRARRLLSVGVRLTRPAVCPGRDSRRARRRTQIYCRRLCVTCGGISAKGLSREPRVRVAHALQRRYCAHSSSVSLLRAHRARSTTTGEPRRSVKRAQRRSARGKRQKRPATGGERLKQLRPGSLALVAIVGVDARAGTTHPQQLQWPLSARGGGPKARAPPAAAARTHAHGPPRTQLHTRAAADPSDVVTTETEM
jgi:hypothetical protein